MWFLVVIAGIAVNVGLGHLARRAFLAELKTCGRLIEFVRWPAWGACIWVAIGLARHDPSGNLAWQALIGIGGGMAGQLTYLLAKSAYRTVRILRRRRAAQGKPGT